MPNDPVAQAREDVLVAHVKCMCPGDREVIGLIDEHLAAIGALIAAAEARGRASVMPSLDAVVWLASKTGFAFTGLAAPLRPLVDASADWTTKRRHAAIDEVVAWFRAALSTPEVPRG